MYEKSCILLARLAVRKISSVECVFSLKSIILSTEYMKFMQFLIKLRFFVEKKPPSFIVFCGILYRLFHCNRTFYYIGMVSVTPASYNLTPVSRFQNRLSMYT